tara:strand:- start:9 stop:164 length:156 start_codon:yes stop_codon:yes gene_type:complete
MKKITLLTFFSLAFAQRLEPIDIAMEDLRTVVETASRSEQRVIIDDFTGLE